MGKAPALPALDAPDKFGDALFAAETAATPADDDGLTFVKTVKVFAHTPSPHIRRVAEARNGCSTTSMTHRT